MKNSPLRFITETVKLWAACLVELLFYLPVWILLHVFLPSPVDPAWLYLLPLLSLAGVLLRRQLAIRWRQLIAALLLGLGLGLLSGNISVYAIPLAVAGSLFAYRGMNASTRRNATGIYAVGLVLYFIAAIVFPRYPQLQPTTAFLTGGGSLCLIITLLANNKVHLRYSSLSGDTAPLPQALRRHNNRYVLLFVIAAAVLAAGAGQAIGFWLWNSLRMFLRWLIQLSSHGGKPPVPETTPPPIMQSPPLPEAREPGLLGLIWDIILYGLAISAVSALLFYALRWLYRNSSGILHRAIDALLSILRKEDLVQDAAYVDEEKNIFAWEKTVQYINNLWTSRLGFATRRDRYENLTGNRERVRWLYRQWINSKRAEGYEAKNYLTPHETGADVSKWSEDRKRQRRGRGGNVPAATPENLLKLYDKARYGEEEPSAAEVAELKSSLQ